jgi:HSP20 family protein
MLLGSECRSLELHFFPGRRVVGPARWIRENDMTVTTSWDLFEDLRSVHDELVRMSMAPGYRPSQPGQQYDTAGMQAWAPVLDISERKDAYLVAAELPGVGIEDLEITFEDGLLTIQGQRHPADRPAGVKVHRAERRYGPFRRSITLPSHVKADAIEASAQDGVLLILVPKAEEVQAKRIQVRPGRGKAALKATAVENGA